MTDYQLNNIDPEDIDELLIQVEKSFDIKFGNSELSHITTFGELCDHIANKIELENSEDCTTQQAFYKLRQSICHSLNIKPSELAPATMIAEILPRQNRIAYVKSLESHLGFKLNILRPKHSISNILTFTLLVSLVMLFFQWQVSVLGLFISIFGLSLAAKMGKELDLTTLGQLAKKMARENYLKSRRKSKTYNKIEVEIVLKKWFSVAFDLKESELTRDAKLI